jgi:hypothetical protein
MYIISIILVGSIFSICHKNLVENLFKLKNEAVSWFLNLVALLQMIISLFHLTYLPISYTLVFTVG